MTAITTAWSIGVEGEWLDRIKIAILIITTLTGWYQAWAKDKEVTATQQQVTAVANVYSTYYYYGDCDK